METIGLYEPAELSLFGGELLMGLGSPLGPDHHYIYPEDHGDGTNVIELLGKEEFSPQKPNLTASVVSSHTENKSIQDQASGLDLSWLDTKLDLYDLLRDGTDGSLATPEVSMSSPDVPQLSLTPTTISSTTEVPVTAEDLFNQIAHGQDGAESPLTVETESCDNLLSEVFNKLSSDIEQMVNADAMDVPDLGNGVLSPVSVDDIESLLSGPVSPANTSPADSSLESLLSSRASSPASVQYDISFESDADVGPIKSKSRKRSKPYNQGPLLDRKERKKLQNKTAALKYRQKKKIESESTEETCQKLEDRNKQLKDKVDSMTREIQYLKDLMGEVMKAKGIKTS